MIICTNCKKGEAIEGCDLCDPCLGEYEGHCQAIAEGEEAEAKGELWDENLYVHDWDMGSPEANEQANELKNMLRTK